MPGETDRRTDTVPFHRSCSAYYTGSANKELFWLSLDDGRRVTALAETLGDVDSYRSTRPDTKSVVSVGSCVAAPFTGTDCEGCRNKEAGLIDVAEQHHYATTS